MTRALSALLALVGLVGIAMLWHAGGVPSAAMPHQASGLPDHALSAGDAPVTGEQGASAADGDTAAALPPPEVPELMCGSGEGHGGAMAAHAAPRAMAPVPRSGPFHDAIAAKDVRRAAARLAMAEDRPHLTRVQGAHAPEWLAEVVGSVRSAGLGDGLLGARTMAAEDRAPLSLPLLLAAAGQELLAPVAPAAPTPAPPSATPPPAATEPPVNRGPTYWGDAYRIIRQECATCHYAGGIGPFPLETYDQAAEAADLIQWAVQERIMPPLPADPELGLPFDDPRIMSDEDRTTLIAWVEAGAPEGDVAERPELPPVVRDPYGEPDAVFDIGTDYSPPADQLDTYRCFVIDPGLQRDTEISMVDLVPTADAMFHHGILFLATPGQVDRVAELDAADPGPGYECFGGPGFGSPDWVAMEAVGSPALPYPDGTAKVIPAGSQLVLQLHYNTLNGVQTDRTEVRVWLPEAQVDRQPRDHEIANFLFMLPPGKKDNVATWDVAITAAGQRGPLLRQSMQAGKLWRIWGHMHMLGTEFRFDLIKPDGTEIRVLDIPRWDFNWQGAYDLVEPLPLEPGDTLRMTCEWDNSPENQPYVDGQQVEPRSVTWGEGTMDEMCLGGVTLTD